jgi:hypothetical protein
MAAYRAQTEAEDLARLTAMSCEESIEIGEALLRSELMQLALPKNDEPPKCLAVALGIRERWAPP